MPLSGSSPPKLFVSMSNSVTAINVQMPHSGSVPVKLLLLILNTVIVFNVWIPLSGKFPVQPVPSGIVALFLESITKATTATVVLSCQSVQVGAEQFKLNGCSFG
eukprot:4217564-Amphidinium_carterae.1